VALKVVKGNARVEVENYYVKGNENEEVVKEKELVVENVVGVDEIVDFEIVGFVEYMRDFVVVKDWDYEKMDRDVKEKDEK
jgi:hypothetical protein